MNEVFSKARYLVDYLLDDHKPWGLQAWFSCPSSIVLNRMTWFISVEIMWKSVQNERTLESAGVDALVSSAERSFRGFSWFHRLGVPRTFGFTNRGFHTLGRAVLACPDEGARAYGVCGV